MRLKPRDQRKHSADEIIQELRPKMAGVAGIQMYMQNLPSIRIGGTLTKSQYQYTLQSPDNQELYRSVADFEARLRALPQLQDVTNDMQIKNPQVNVEIDRDKAAAFGLSAQQVEDALYYVYGSRQVSTIYASNWPAPPCPRP
jgi:HAE1 family hydrophobic/amphiphilic exporter-1